MKKIICVILSVITLFGIVFVGSPRASAEEMQSSQAFIDLLKKREGFSPKPYWDNSHYSIGYGTTCPDNMVDYYNKNPMSEELAEQEMRKSLAGFEGVVRRYAEKHSLTLTQNQFDALVSFSYNCGDSWSTGGSFSNAIKAGATGSDLVYAFCLWSKSGGEYILIGRRLFEANMYLNGIYQNEYDFNTGTFRCVFLDGGAGDVRYAICGYDAADPKAVKAEFSKIPTGTDANGNSFTYEFAGWYTEKEGGKQVQALDGSLPHKTVLYARWKDPKGNVAYIEPGVPCKPLVITAKKTINIRVGPGTQYSKTGSSFKAGTSVTLTRIYEKGSTRWGKFSGGWVSLNADYSNFDVVLSASKGYPKVGIATGGVNIRTGPSTSKASVRKTKSNEELTIVEQTFSGSMYWGKLEDGNWISLSYVKFADDVYDDPYKIHADLNGDDKINKDDAIYMLRHVVYPEKYSVPGNCDVDGNEVVDKDDAVYLLRHVVYPEKYPLIS